MNAARRWVCAASSAAVLGIALGASASAPILARGGGTLTVGRVRRSLQLLARPIPRTPWTVRARATLRGIAARPAVATDDREIAVVLTSPASLVWVASDGTIARTLRLDDRPSAPIAVGLAGRVYVPVEGRALYVVAPDASLRAIVPLAFAMTTAPIVRADGRVQVLAPPASAASESYSAVLHSFAPDGERLAMTPIHGASLVAAMPALDGDDCLWIPSAGRVACMTPSGRRLGGGFVASASRIVPLGSGVLATSDGGVVEFRTHEGALRGRADIGGELTALTAGGLDRVLVVRVSAVSEVVSVASDGSVAARVPAPSSPTDAPLADATGAFVVSNRSGEVIAYEPNGTERWRLTVGSAIVQPMTPLPEGGVALCTSSGELVVLH